MQLSKKIKIIGFNPVNSPHLTPAVELDTALLEYSANLAQHGITTNPKSAADVRAIIDGVKAHVLTKLKLWEYYVINVQAEKEKFAKEWDAPAKEAASGVDRTQLRGKTLGDAFGLIQKNALRNRMTLGARYTTHVDIPVAVSIFKDVAGNASKEAVVEAFGKALDKINVPLYGTYDDDVKAILENVAGRLTYMRIEDNGPKMGEITKE